MELTWLDEPTVDALRAALCVVAPDLADATIVPRGLEPNDDPRYCTASAVVDGRFVVKFAWAGPAALRICHQAQILDALRTAAPRLPLPEVAAVSRDPAMLILRWVPATPFFGVRHRIGPAVGDEVILSQPVFSAANPAQQVGHGWVTVTLVADRSRRTMPRWSSSRVRSTRPESRRPIRSGWR